VNCKLDYSIKTEKYGESGEKVRAKINRITGVLTVDYWSTVTVSEESGKLQDYSKITGVCKKKAREF
jgi:Cys-tRNA synthase (O-phospho-L-seryl-tRNA:Cys-tRNA synthase)